MSTSLLKKLSLTFAVTFAIFNVYAANTSAPASATTSTAASTANSVPVPAQNVSTVATPSPTVQTPSPAPASPAPQAQPTPTLTPTAPNVNAAGYVLMDADSGQVLASLNPDVRRPPASLTKLMTLYVISEALKNGQIHLDDKVLISKDAWQTGGSRMFVQVGTSVPVKDLIEGIIVASGNDACVAMSEYVAGTQATFTELMNQAAASLGMKNSHFTDATGLPNPDHYSTPYDLALLARSIITHFPQYYYWYGQKWITWNNIKQPNRNRLLWRDIGVDGLKTGHTQEAGYCLIASAKQNGMRLISVVMGAPSDNARTDDSQALLTYGFRFFETHKLYSANTTLDTPRVWMGTKDSVPMGLARDLYVTIPKNQYKNLKATLELKKNLRAPIVKGQAYGTIRVTLNGQEVANAPLVALADDPQGGFFTRMWDHVGLLFHGWFTKA